MSTKSVRVGFKIAKIQQQIIQLEHQNAVLTLEDKQKLQQLSRTLQNLYQTYDIDARRLSFQKVLKVEREKDDPLPIL